MRAYFEKMAELGKALPEPKPQEMDNVAQVRAVMKEIVEEADKVKNAGLSPEKINARGQLKIGRAHV